MATDGRPLLILGAGPFGVDIADVASEIPGVTVAGFVEGVDRSHCSEPLEGLPVYWIDDLPRLAATHTFVCAVGTTRRRAFIQQAERAGCDFTTLVHPSARVSPRSALGPGTILSAGVILAARSQLGAHVSVNRGATVGHHTHIGDFVTVGPGANIAGTCRIGAATYIGIGATIIDHISIGEGSIVGAGAVVTKNAPDHVLLVGVPARVMKHDVDGL